MKNARLNMIKCIIKTILNEKTFSEGEARDLVQYLNDQLKGRILYKKLSP